MTNFQLKCKLASTITYLLVWLSEMRYSRRRMAGNIYKSVGLMAMCMMSKFRPMLAHKCHSPAYRQMADPNHNNPWFDTKKNGTSFVSYGWLFCFVISQLIEIETRCCWDVAVGLGFRLLMSQLSTNHLELSFKFSTILCIWLRMRYWKRAFNWFCFGENSRVEHFFP